MEAPREVVPVVLRFVQPSSVLDVGCGTGTWLRAFEEAGVHDYLGVDGDYVDRSMLNIPAERFVTADISRPLGLRRKFDLVVCLEVAEHVAPEHADTLIQSLVDHGDVILFSAAVPGQGGQNHLNEQWPEYWQDKFKKHGYYFHDLVRPHIWHDIHVNWWYRQNIFLVTREYSDKAIMSVVHPALYELKAKGCQDTIEAIMAGGLGIIPSTKVLLMAIKHKFSR